MTAGLFIAGTLQAEELANLPEAVQKTVKTELGTAQIDEIERDTDDGKVVYNVEAETADGRDIELEVAEDGTLLERQEEVSLADVPAAVRATIERELAGVSPEKIERHTKQGTISYEVDAEVSGKEIELEIGADGTLLDKDVEGDDDNGDDDDGDDDDGDDEDGDDEDGDDDDGPVVGFKYVPTGMQITIGGKPFASYYTASTKIPRPYFANVKSPSGVQVSRNHPPIEGKDSMDHDTFHPGIWLTFAGINGNDYWRLKQRTEHEMYIGTPKSGPGKGTFTVSNFYLDSIDTSGNRIAHEVCKYTILARPNYNLLIYDSTISSDEHELRFGDDEEYGLGIRVQTPIEERYGGQILNADGLKGEKGPNNAYGKASDWCDYSGMMDGTFIGMTVMPDPKNFRRSWYHVRDYGLIAANLFGSKKVAGLERNDVVVKKGEKFHLGFGVAIYSAPDQSKVDRNAMYKDYLKQVK